MADIQRLENELQESKRMLLTLNSKLQSMEAEIAELKKLQPIQTQQPAELQTDQLAKPQVQQPVQPVQPQAQQPVQPMKQPQGSIYQQAPVYAQKPQQPAQPQMQPQMQPQTPQPQQAQQQTVRPQMLWNQKYDSVMDPAPHTYQQPQPKKLHYSEEMLGKTIMGIAASVLIFISLILFAMLVIPHLTEGMKVALMLMISIGITAVGLIMWFRKEKKSTFFLSLGACGVGSIYISLFMCNAYFHIINDIVLYVLILLWAAGVLVLSKYKQRLFEIIGESGILISILFGCYSCTKSDDSTMLMVLTIYSIIGVIAFLGFRYKDDISLLIHGVAGTVGIVALTASNNTIIGSAGMTGQNLVIFGLLAVFSIAIIALYLYRSNNENVSYLIPISIIISILLDVIVYHMFTDEKIGCIAVILVSIALYVLLEYLKSAWKEKIGVNAFGILMDVWQIIELFAIIFCVLDVDYLKDYVGPALVAIPLIIYGFIKEDRFTQIKGLGAYGILVFCATMNETAYTILTIGCFAIITIFMYVKKNIYSEVIKDISYGLFILGLVIAYVLISEKAKMNFEVAAVSLLWILGIVNLAALKTPYAKSWLTHDDETPFKILNYSINAVLMIFSLVLVMEVSDDIQHFMAVLGAIGLFCINSVNILKKKNKISSIYLGLKFTILVMVILSSYDAPNYILSISAFILAIVFIVIGFMMDIKSLRIYGLVLSLICVIKLVMIDITYDNTLGHALSFFISGVLCFVISAVYSVAEKRLKAK